MVQFNGPRRQLHCRILYVGPEGAGKRASLRAVSHSLPSERRGEPTVIVDELDPDLRSERLEVSLGKFASLRTCLHLATVPPRHCPGWFLDDLWRGVDGVVFVVDARASRLSADVRCLDALRETLHGPRVQDGKGGARTVPMVFQWNHRDALDALSVVELRAHLDPRGRWPGIESRADCGDGALAALKKATSLALETLDKRYALGAPRWVAHRQRARWRSTTRAVPREVRQASLAEAPAPARTIPIKPGEGSPLQVLESPPFTVRGVREEPRRGPLGRLFELARGAFS